MAERGGAVAEVWGWLTCLMGLRVLQGEQEGSCQPWHKHLLRRDQAVLENESAL